MYHDYRLEFDGIVGFTLFQDELEILTGQAYEAEPDHGTVKRIGWGEGSSFAFGQSSWESFGHSAIEPIFSDSFEDAGQSNGLR